MVAVKQLAQVFRRALGYAVDVFGNRTDILGYPGRRRTGWGRQRIAKYTGGTGKDKRANLR